MTVGSQLPKKRFSFTSWQPPSQLPGNRHGVLFP